MRGVVVRATVLRVTRPLGERNPVIILQSHEEETFRSMGISYLTLDGPGTRIPAGILFSQGIRKRPLRAEAEKTSYNKQKERKRKSVFHPLMPGEYLNPSHSHGKKEEEERNANHNAA
ncbi:hypothetical protein J2TS4_54270 [Paenibacillus sp. J2TS4]|nr:hypothetical protein J2TS4_54270 [Paenibacillus sp. J2TS4]